MKSRVLSMALLMLVPAGSGCGGREGGHAFREAGETLGVTILADSAESARMPPAAAGLSATPRLTLVRVASARADVGTPLPDPEPSVPPGPEAAPPEPEADDALRPPLPRGPALVRLPATRRGWVELDVRVDERGEVTDAIPVGGDTDPAILQAAADAAFAMRWYPATRRGEPVAVWCRQRFETGPGR